MKYRLLVHILFLMQFVLLVNSQATDCPVEIEIALNTANEICVGTGRNQVCYGNNDVNIMPYEAIDIEFDSPGDIAELNDIRALSLSALDVENGQWGIAVMRLLANMNPSQSEDLTVLLFGDVEIEDASGKQQLQSVVANTYANMRRLPDSESTVMDSVAIGDVVQATGRLEDNSWVRVVNPTTNITGWIFASLLDGVDFDALNVVDASEPYFAPMQAFYFESGTDSVDCASVPKDGIIVQTPEGLRRVTLWVNEVTIDFLSTTGSTASIQTENDGSMSINVLEGSVYVGSDTNGYTAVAGSSVNVKKPGDSGDVSISKPTSTNPDVMANMPLDSLDRQVIMPAPADEQVIAEANNYAGAADTASSEADGSTTGSTNVNNSGGNGNPPDTPPGLSNNECPGNSCDAPGKDNQKDKKPKKKNSNRK